MSHIHGQRQKFSGVGTTDIAIAIFNIKVYVLLLVKLNLPLICEPGP